jgi:hypothetical protein
MDTAGREWIGGERRAKDRVKTDFKNIFNVFQQFSQFV